MLMHYWRRGGIQSDREWEELFGDFTGGESSAEIRKDDLYKVAGKSNKVRINNEHDDHMTVLPVDEILMRAYSRMDEAKYNLATNNCEHFVVWCRYGTNYSKQASKVKMSVANMAISAFAGQEYANQVTGWVEQNLPTIASVIPTLFDEKTSPL
ncbi:hypothetical protein WR25_19591 isoform B [Diploscapter pachys]|nr:hypothetical protein WR25_19591 isoform B [Diploscapter pachys]